MTEPKRIWRADNMKKRTGYKLTAVLLVMALSLTPGMKAHAFLDGYSTVEQINARRA